MKADRKSLKEIFVMPVRLVAPLFQRPYVWEEQHNWEPLWKSVREVAEARLAGQEPSPCFLGAIVLDQLPNQIGSVEQRQIIDGQQRLTTLQILLAAIQDTCCGRGLDRLQMAFQKFTHNDLPLSDDPDESFKVWPTNSDQKHFRRTMTARSREALLTGYDAPADTERLRHRVPTAYLYFEQALSDWLNGDSDESLCEGKLKALHTALERDILLVAIDLEDNDDPQLIFETLNALGTPLLPADLVKNYLFHEADKAGLDKQKLHSQYWQMFDENDVFWRKEVRQGRLNRPRIDLFLQHYLTLMTKEEVGATHLFVAFRRFAASRQDLGVEDHFRLLRKYANVFTKWATYAKDTPEGLFFYRLDQLDTTTVYPLLLEVFNQRGGADDQEELRGILKHLESYLVRRTICGLTTADYNHFFIDLLQHLGTNGFTAAAVEAFLEDQSSDTRRWPSDHETAYHWRNRPVYHTIVRKRLRMILEALEFAHHNDWTERIEIGQRLPVEHVMPVAWRDHWPLPENLSSESLELARRQRDHIVHTIGNLTLITAKLNSSVSNGGWAKKKEGLWENSVLKMNRDLHAHDDWNEETIHGRTDDLLAKATALWARPAGGPAFDPEYRPKRERLSKEDRQAYWQDFTAGGNWDEFVAAPKPGSGGYLRVLAGRSGVFYLVFMEPRKKLIGVGISCGGRLGRPVFDQLLARKQDVEEIVGQPLSWEDRPEGARWIMLRKTRTIVTNREDWPNQHAWLQENVERLRQAFESVLPKVQGKSVKSAMAACVKDVLVDRGDFEILRSGSNSVWFLPRAWSCVPENCTVWPSLSRHVSVTAWVVCRPEGLTLHFELGQMDDVATRLRCVQALTDAGLSFTPEALRPEAKYSRFMCLQKAVADPQDLQEVRQATHDLLHEAADDIDRAGVALEQVFGDGQPRGQEMQPPASTPTDERTESTAPAPPRPGVS